jgi:hypothetical protein
VAGLGKIQQAVLTFLENAAKAGADRDFTTADVARAVYGVAEPLRYHHLAVRRVLTRLQPGRLPGMDGWTFGRTRNRRAWFLVAPQPQQAQGEPPPSAPLPRPDGRLAGAMRLLASDAPGERDAALMACTRLLSARGMGWSDVAALVERQAAAAR